ncbi:hypothetical protein SO802_032623 [Lithocarpus litseifolius]|uniref:Uncharacterized protein n=1 Tax=Lithocarpus litseifolius TaxID=425828 RepID=A0AAW2BCB1_9ROSI
MRVTLGWLKILGPYAYKEIEGHKASSLIKIQQEDTSAENLDKEKFLALVYHEQLKHDEVLWKHKSHVDWLACLDPNTGCFYLSTNICRRKRSKGALVRFHTIKKKISVEEKSVTLFENNQDVRILGRKKGCGKQGLY